MVTFSMSLYKTALLSALLFFTIQAYGQECQLSVSIEPAQHNPVSKLFYGNSLFLQSYSLLKTLISKTPCTLEIIPLPSNRALKMLEDGSLEVMVGMSKTQAREKHSYFVGSFHTERIVVVGNHKVKPSPTDLESILDTDGLISITNGAYYGVQWEEALKTDPMLKHRLVYLSDNQRKLSMLMLNRVTFSLEDEQVIDEFLKREEYKEHFTKLFVLHENPVYFAFSKKAISKKLHQLLIKELIVQV